MELKDSKTLQNLMTAFAGESQARNKYTFYAQKARDDGYVQIAEIFEETAHNEKEHAELWLKLWHGGDLPGTLDNLTDAMTKILSSALDVPADRIYVRYEEVAYWGWNGSNF